MTWKTTTLGTDAGQWSPHWDQSAVVRLAQVIIIGGALGVSAFNGTSAISVAKLSGYELSRDWTNTGPARSEEEVTAPVAVLAQDPSAADLIAELRRISGLTWQHVARLFDVDRRAVHFWASGRPMSDANAEHLSRLLVLLRQVDRGVPSKVREWLLAPPPEGVVPLESLAAKRYEDVVAPSLTGTTPKRPLRISAEASAKRRPLSPHTLLQQETPAKPSAQRLLASKPIKVKRNG